MTSSGTTPDLPGDTSSRSTVLLTLTGRRPPASGRPSRTTEVTSGAAASQS